MAEQLFNKSVFYAQKGSEDMAKYKVGDKFIVEIDEVMPTTRLGYAKTGDESVLYHIKQLGVYAFAEALNRMMKVQVENGIEEE